VHISAISPHKLAVHAFSVDRETPLWDDYARIHLHLYTAPLHTHLYYVITLHIPPHTSTFDLYGLLPDPLRLTLISTNHSCSLRSITRLLDLQPLQTTPALYDLLLDFSTSNLYKPLSANSVAVADRPLTKTNFLKNLETLERCDICHDPFNESHVPTRTSC
jgi:hypothetical protein